MSKNMIYHVVPLVLIKHCVTLKAMHAVHRLKICMCIYRIYRCSLHNSNTRNKTHPHS